MKAAKPHFLLFSESRRKQSHGEWRFVLQAIDGAEQFEAADAEPDVRGERLELLAVVRGLEALEQPSRVTLVTPSKYVNRGLLYGLSEWRANGWQWEHYGEMAPVKNRDLWQRLDHALMFHQIECRTWRFDLPHGAAEDSPSDGPRPHATAQGQRPGRLRRRLKRHIAACVRWRDEWRRRAALGVAQCGTRLFPLPWLQ